jgi:hypothetical protein
MPKQKLPDRVRFEVKVFYHLGINNDFTAGMPFVAHYMDGIPMRYAQETERLVNDSIQRLLREFNDGFDIGIFRFSFSCKRKESTHKGKHIPHKKSKMLLLIKRRVTRMANKIKKAILLFFTLAQKNLVRISTTMKMKITTRVEVVITDTLGLSPEKSE